MPQIYKFFYIKQTIIVIFLYICDEFLILY